MDFLETFKGQPTRIFEKSLKNFLRIFKGQKLSIFEGLLGNL